MFWMMLFVSFCLVFMCALEEVGSLVFRVVFFLFASIVTGVSKC